MACQAAAMLLPQECYFNVPRAAWLCRHDTSLLCSSARKSISAPAFGAAQCTNLQQLRFNHCLFGGGAFPASLCSALRQLSSLGIRGGGLTSLPSEFSQLRSAGMECSCAFKCRHVAQAGCRCIADCRQCDYLVQFLTGLAPLQLGGQ